MMSGASPVQRLSQLGVVFQSRALDVDISVRQNLMYHAALHGIASKRADELIARVLDRVAMADRSRDRVGNLSIGQMRRIEIARSLLHQPRLLLLDEPTVGLDIKARADILDHVRRLSVEQGIGVLWATHLIDEAGAGDDVVVLHKGSVLAQGTVGDVIGQSGGADLREAFNRLTGTADQGELEAGPMTVIAGSTGQAPLYAGTVFHLPEGHRLARSACASFISANVSSRRWSGRWSGCSFSPPAFARCSASRSSRPTRPMCCTRSISRPA